MLEKSAYDKINSVCDFIKGEILFLTELCGGERRKGKMAVRECYDAIGGNYNEIMGRMMTEERVLKFLKMFLKDETIYTLDKEIANQNYEDAFRAAHTMKGLCQNMAFTWLHEPVEELTECLRNSANLADVPKYLAQVKERYEVTRREIEKL